MKIYLGIEAMTTTVMLRANKEDLSQFAYRPYLVLDDLEDILEDESTDDD